ncbi:unnamed protein product [Peronospora belbahrii]|uniref:Myotubularin phosphatase domain-containing protein n=1 Tax=Peronospora belbahrii TaxID=622444 RepID=A0ABN8D0C2_9STRA|nr:unnamed protein product [Peronospora belbahrii]
MNGDGFDLNLMLEGNGIMTLNGQRHVPFSTCSPVFTKEISYGNYCERERTGSEDTDYASTHNDGILQTLPGEAVLVKNDNVYVRFLDRTEHMGRLYVTNYRLVFIPILNSVVDGSDRVRYLLKEAEMETNVRKDELPYGCDLHTQSVVAYQAIPLVTIERVKRKEMVETDSGLLEVLGKDFRRLQFIFAGLVFKQTFSKFDRTYALVRLHALGEPDGKVDEFAKFSLERFDGVNGAVDGWRIYNAVSEFQRMGICSTTDRWRLSFINDEYDLCPTYPSVLAVPTSASDSVLAVASKFRSKGRIPVLSWRDRYTGAVICRSSQPLVGLGQKQCDKDVFLIQAIAATNPSSTKLVIIDARPWRNAVAQKTVGRAGYELTEHYETCHTTASLKDADMVASEHNRPVVLSAGAASSTFAGACIHGDSTDVNEAGEWGGIHTLETMKSSLVLTECKLIFMGIENIHTMRKSYHKLMDLCTTKQSNEKWLDQLASTHWMNHISRILDSAVEIARIVKEQKSSVLIHCSDGWDRTAQLTSLTELMIDPYYRTIFGFQRLIEKEWCSFGHKFRDRTSHGASNHSSESSPVFLQWVDCVWQVLVQFPSAFEFNERYLILILDHLYSCRFGTFLYNSERERVEQEALHPTQSLWSYLSTVDRAIVINPFYQSHNASPLKWKASVTATRQCFERPVSRSYEPARVIPHMTQQDFEASSLTVDNRNTEMVKDATDLSDWTVAHSNSPTSVACESTVAVASSSSCSGADTIDIGVNACLETKLRRHRFDSCDLQLGGNMCNGWNSGNDSEITIVQPACHHKLVRDLDAGFSFPQPFDVSSLSKLPSSPLVVPPSRADRVRFFSNTSDTETALEDDEMGRCSTLTSCDEMIIPSCSIKSLHFWAHYYLRWDPSSHFDRDASVKLEALHLDLVMRLKSLTKQIDVSREGEVVKLEHKMQHFLYDPEGCCASNGRASSSQSPPRERQCCNQSVALGGSTSFQDSSFEAADACTVGSKNTVADPKFCEQIAKLKQQKLQRFEKAEEIYQEQLARLLTESNCEKVEFT